MKHIFFTIIIAFAITGYIYPQAVQNSALSLPTPGVNTNYIAIPFQPSMVSFGKITIEAWVKIGGRTTPNTILNKGAEAVDFQFGVGEIITHPYFDAGEGGATTSNILLYPGIWAHLAITYDGVTAKFYKDGALAGSQLVTLKLGSSTNEMRIGRGDNNPGSGNIDELRLWSVARTQGQIDSNKCKKYPNTFGNTEGLIAVWHFDNTYTDSVSNYNGSAMGDIGFDTVSYPVPGANCIVAGIQQNNTEVPDIYSLDQNFPNPFNPTTTIKFSIPKNNYVEIKIFDLLGAEVQTILSDPLEEGNYSINFNAEALPSGVYFYKITAGEFTESKKMLLIK